jgi:predicted Zn-dependent protease
MKPYLEDENIKIKMRALFYTFNSYRDMGKEYYNDLFRISEIYQNEQKLHEKEYKYAEQLYLIKIDTAVALINLNNIDKGLEILQECKKEIPLKPEAYYYMIKTYIDKLNQLDKALNVIEECSSINFNNNHNQLFKNVEMYTT